MSEFTRRAWVIGTGLVAGLAASVVAVPVGSKLSAAEADTAAAKALAVPPDDAVLMRDGHGGFVWGTPDMAPLFAQLEKFQDALERIALLDEADGHELTVKHAFEAVDIACEVLGNKHPATIFAERYARGKYNTSK